MEWIAGGSILGELQGTVCQLQVLGFLDYWWLGETFLSYQV